MRRGYAVQGEGVQYKERVCRTMRVTSAVPGEGVQYKKRVHNMRREGVQYKERVHSMRRGCTV